LEDPAAKIPQLEAILFLAREPLTSRKLSQHANLADGTQARTLIRQLNRKLDNLGRSFRVEEVAGGFQLVTRSKFAPWLRRLEHLPRETRLSAPAMETLAVVSYRQPVIRADIEAVRGVGCGEILNQLLNRDLVRISGRSEELGRPYLYSTTKTFLRLFGLRSLDELPRNDYLTENSIAVATEPTEGGQVESLNRLSEGEIEED
jgi:segregation and condensation protein B